MGTTEVSWTEWEMAINRRGMYCYHIVSAKIKDFY